MISPLEHQGTKITKRGGEMGRKKMQDPNTTKIKLIIMIQKKKASKFDSKFSCVSFVKPLECPCLKMQRKTQN